MPNSSGTKIASASYELSMRLYFLLRDYFDPTSDLAPLAMAPSYIEPILQKLVGQRIGPENRVINDILVDKVVLENDITTIYLTIKLGESDIKTSVLIGGK